MAKKTSTRKSKTTAASNGKVSFTKEQQAVLNEMATSATELSEQLSNIFNSEQLTARQKRAVKRLVIEPVTQPFSKWRKENIEAVDSRKEEREQARVERIAKKRARLAEQRQRLAAREAKLQAQEKALSKR